MPFSGSLKPLTDPPDEAEPPDGRLELQQLGPTHPPKRKSGPQSQTKSTSPLKATRDRILREKVTLYSTSKDPRECPLSGLIMQMLLSQMIERRRTCHDISVSLTPTKRRRRTGQASAFVPVSCKTSKGLAPSEQPLSRRSPRRG